MNNIAKALENRQYSGTRLNKHSVFFNRASANRIANRKVRSKLETAHQRKRQAARESIRRTEEYVHYMSSVPVRSGHPANAAFRTTMLERSHAAQESLAQARRAYDELVVEANEVIKNWETVQSHYRAQYTS
jgi:ElaB/YqjD/DUF883 family membrane-anchored ribosome-binding protein